MHNNPKPGKSSQGVLLYTVEMTRGSTAQLSGTVADMTAKMIDTTDNMISHQIFTAISFFAIISCCVPCARCLRYRVHVSVVSEVLQLLLPEYAIRLVESQQGEGD